MNISITTSELQRFPDAAKKAVPTMDVTALKAIVEGVSFPVAGALALDILIGPNEHLHINLITQPDPVPAVTK